MKAECTNCGEIDEFNIDGYSFGDHLLQGVMFTINKDGKARIQPEDEGYFEGLNKEYWCALAEDHTNEGVDDGVCPTCGDGEVLSGVHLQWAKDNEEK